MVPYHLYDGRHVRSDVTDGLVCHYFVRTGVFDLTIWQASPQGDGRRSWKGARLLHRPLKTSYVDARRIQLGLHGALYLESCRPGAHARSVSPTPVMLFGEN